MKENYLGGRSLSGHRMGEHHHNSKLSDEQVRELRELRELNPKLYTYKRLAEIFNCGVRTAQDIARYATRYSA